jgi:hypothetical protein
LYNGGNSRASEIGASFLAREAGPTGPRRMEAAEVDEPFARTGPGAFQWNAGGWFGSQVGGTAWLLSGVIQPPAPVPWLRGAWLAAFLLANAVGLALWWRRDRLAPFPATLALLATCGLAGTLALAATAAVAPPVGVRNLVMTPADAAWTLAGLWGLLLLLGAFFTSIERAALRPRRAPGPVGMAGAIDVAQRDRWRQRATQPRADDPWDPEGHA